MKKWLTEYATVQTILANYGFTFKYPPTEAVA